MSINRTRKPWPILSLALPLAFLVGGCNKATQPDPQVTAKLEGIRKAGLPVTLSELNSWYVEPPEVEDATPGYTAAFAALSPIKYTDPKFLAENEKALKLFHAAASRVKCRYPVDLSRGSGALMVHLPKVKQGTQLLAAEALAHATKGEMDQAARSLLDGFGLARSLDEEPVLISRLVQIAAEIILQRGVEAVLNQKPFPEAQLARLQVAAQEAEEHGSLSRALIGERSMAIDAFQRYQRSPASEQAKFFASLGNDFDSDSSRRVDPEALRKGSDFKADFNFYLDRIEEILSAARMPYPQALAGLSEWTHQVGSATGKGCLISGLLLPSLANAPVREAGVIARLRLMQVALAVERFRLAHRDTLPESLSQLTPEFLSAVPQDPFDGHPLRFIKGKIKGYTVYSVDKDGRDDHGARRPEDGSAGDSGYDLTFIVRR